MTYEQHVREVAEEMAIDYANGAVSWNGVIDKEILIKLQIKNARIAVRREANAFKDAYVLGMSDCGVDFLAEDPDLNGYLIERGLTPAPEVKKCDHKECQWGICNTTGEPICGCCGAYVNTVMTEDEKREEKQQIFDATDLNVYKVHDRGYLCYNVSLECESPNRCSLDKYCYLTPLNEQK